MNEDKFVNCCVNEFVTNNGVATLVMYRIISTKCP
jgi:hypothetical protein